MILKVILAFLMVSSICSWSKADTLESHIAGRPGSLSVYVVQLGETKVQLQVIKYGPGPAFVALHENESTSVAAALKVVPYNGGILIKLMHGGKRNVEFVLDGKKYSFDPNRIFTSAGIRKTLSSGSSPAATTAVRHLAQTILGVIGKRPVVALHNNTNGNYSVKSYLPGNELSRDASDVYQVTGQDNDDFFFITDKLLYEQAKKSGFNAVLQSLKVTDDGSLSVYSKRHGLAYVNVEAEQGHSQIQLAMLRWLSKN